MKIKRMLSALLTVVLVMGSFAGCGKEKNAEAEEMALMPSISTAATGRYVEKEIQLPACQYAADMVMQSDGRLRLALNEESGKIMICTQGQQENTWETDFLPDEILSSGSVENVALHSDGTIFCDTIEDLGDGTYQPHLWVIDPDDSYRELPVDFSDLDATKGYFIAYADYTDDGRLMAEVYVGGLHEIDLTTGAFSENLNEYERILSRIGCAGSSTYLLGMESAGYYYDGEIKALPDVLKAQLSAELEENLGNTPKITFWENQDGYLFFTTSGGLYSYIPGGSVTEELISGSRSTLGDPRSWPIALTGCDDGSFYMLAAVDGKPSLCYFTFDDGAPVTTDTQLNIYSMYEDEDITQMIIQFQKANPNITVEHEVGLSGEDGMTEADAIRTLNTEILAGNGPDLICLDGFNLESYLEKGVLADVSHVLDQGDPLLRNITDCYAEDGKICAVPTTFTFPAIYGKEEYVSQIHDLASLVEAAKQAKSIIAPESRVVNGMYPDIMADDYYDSCSPAWMNPDGTLNKEKLTEFYAAMTELYALDEPFRQANEEWMAEVRADYANGEAWLIPGQYTNLSGANAVHGDICFLPAGTLDGMYCYSMVLAGEAEYLGDGYITRPLDGQASNVFLPRRIMGVLNTAQHPQSAETFLAFMLSDDVQSKDLTTGFPVNQVTFDRELSEDRYVDSVYSDGPDRSYHAQWPDAAQREELRGWIESLSTPANTNRTIRYMVMEPMYDCCTGAISPEEAAEKALQSLNLYLSE